MSHETRRLLNKAKLTAPLLPSFLFRGIECPSQRGGQLSVVEQQQLGASQALVEF